MNNLSTADDAPGANPMPQATEQATTTPTPESTPMPAPEPVAPKAESKKPISTVKDITRNLIGNYLGMYVIFNIGYSILYNTLLTKIESTIVLAIVALAIQAIIVFLSWKLGTSFTFRAKSIQREDVQKVMKNLLIFTIVLIVINGIYRFYEVNVTINRALENNYSLRIREQLYKKVATDEQIKEYERKKEEAIAEAKKEVYILLAVLEVGSVAISLSMLLLVEKRLILKHVAEESNVAVPPVQPIMGASGEQGA